MVAGGESGINHEMNGVEILHIHENGDILNEDCKSHQNGLAQTNYTFK